MEGGGEGMNWLETKEEVVIMVILPPCYYCSHCMGYGRENSSIKDTESMMQSFYFAEARPRFSVVFVQLILQRFLMKINIILHCIKTKE